MVWIDHWGCSRDPFADADSTYVSLPSHDEAVAHWCTRSKRSGDRLFSHRGGNGKDDRTAEGALRNQKSQAEVCDDLLSTGRNSLIHDARGATGSRFGREPDRLKSWRALDQSIRAASLQGTHVVLVIDDCQQLTTNTARCDLDYLVRLGTHASAGLTVIQVAQRDLDGPVQPQRFLDAGRRTCAPDPFPGGMLSRDQARGGGMQSNRLSRRGRSLGSRLFPRVFREQFTKSHR